jgi:hypothetical protein
MITQEYKIKLLSDCQEYIPRLAELWYEEISRHWAPGASIEKAKQKLFEHLNHNKMPMAFVGVRLKMPVRHGHKILTSIDAIRDSLSVKE